MITIHQLSVRQGLSGDPTRAVWGDGVQPLERAERAIILIHGYEVSQQKANESYGKLLRELTKSLYPTQPVSRASIFGFHWPGDHRSRAKSALTFSTRIPVATLAGQVLGQKLAQLQPSAEIILVAHSLGCRAALAAVDWLVDLDAEHCPHVSAVFLLAAAVPVGDCESDRPFAIRKCGVRYMVLHSRRDRVLKELFPLGQAFYDRKDEAVGRHGKPYGERWDERIPTGLGHSHYWPSTLVADCVARELYPFVPHRLPALAADSRIAEDAARSLPERNLPTHQLPDPAVGLP